MIPENHSINQLNKPVSVPLNCLPPGVLDVIYNAAELQHRHAAFLPTSMPDCQAMQAIHSRQHTTDSDVPGTAGNSAESEPQGDGCYAVCCTSIVDGSER